MITLRERKREKETSAKMTEAELAIEEKLRKKREEQEQIWQEYLEQREKQRQREEDDLRKLKERQVSSYKFSMQVNHCVFL